MKASSTRFYFTSFVRRIVTTAGRPPPRQAEGKPRGNPHGPSRSGVQWGLRRSPPDHRRSASQTLTRRVQTHPAMRSTVRTSTRRTLSRTLREWGARAAAGLASVGSAVASAPLAACQPEQVVTPPACSDRCCTGNAAAVDCGKYPTLACTEPGNPCTARDYGCANGLYYVRASMAAPATCDAVEAGLTGDD